MPCSGNHALTVVLRSTSDIGIDHRLLSSSAADAARPDWTEPAHKVPPGTTAQNRFFHVRTVRILLRTRGAPQLQPRRTDSKFPDPAGATEPSRTDSENKEEHSPEARGGEPLSSVTSSVLKTGGVTRGRSLNAGTVTALSDVTNLADLKGSADN